MPDPKSPQEIRRISKNAKRSSILAALVIFFGFLEVVVAERPPLPEGSLLCQAEKGVYRIPLGEEKGFLLAPGGSYPRWSPNGTKIAFVRDREIVVSDLEGKIVECVATARAPRAVAFHPEGDELFFTDGDAVKSVDLATKRVKKWLEGHTLRELDISPDGGLLAGTKKGLPGLGWSVVIFELETGKRVFSQHGCGPSFSPDGTLLTILGGKHTAIDLYDWRSGKRIRSVPAPEGKKIDNPFWSNHERYIAANLEGEMEEAVIADIKRSESWRVTENGGCTRADVFIKKAGDSRGGQVLPFLLGLLQPMWERPVNMGLLR